jgi:hypothetical protein
MAALLLWPALPVAGQNAPKTRNVIFVMTDGLRWQEVFRGADAALMNKENGKVADGDALRKAYWRDDAVARREALLPFLWSNVVRNGQIFGNRETGSDAYVTNGHNFSYPGYNEILTGHADARVDSNDKKYNPNVSVLEWLNRRPAYGGKVAAFAAWDAFPFILNAPRAQILVNAGFDPLTLPEMTPELQLLNRLKTDSPRVWEAEPFDNLTFHTTLEYLKLHKPRVLFLSLGETDEWAHAGDYAQYLDSAHRFDRFVRELWEEVQKMPEYRGSTSLILSTDHGRGEAPLGWKDHGEKVPDSRYIWMAFLGPGTRALGERTQVPPVTQNQVAATLAALLGEDYRKDVPEAGEAVAGVAGHGNAPKP